MNIVQQHFDLIAKLVVVSLLGSVLVTALTHVLFLKRLRSKHQAFIEVTLGRPMPSFWQMHQNNRMFRLLRRNGFRDLNDSRARSLYLCAHIAGWVSGCLILFLLVVAVSNPPRNPPSLSSVCRSARSVLHSRMENKNEQQENVPSQAPGCLAPEWSDAG